MTVKVGGPLPEENYLDFPKLRTQASSRLFVAYFPWVFSVFGLCSLVSFWEIAVTCVSILLLTSAILFLFQRPTGKSVNTAWTSNQSFQVLATSQSNRIRLMRTNQYLSESPSWNVFFSCQSNSKVAVMVSAGNSEILIPRAFFQSSAEWRQFTVLIADNVGTLP